MSTNDELRELLAKATPGEWVRDGLTIGFGASEYVHADWRTLALCKPTITTGKCYANAALIVAAVNALPALLDRIEALEAGCEELLLSQRNAIAVAERAEAENARLNDEAADRRYVYEAYHKAEAENESLKSEVLAIAAAIRKLPKATECPALADRLALAAKPKGEL
jgi:hypothetical protein